MTSQETSNFSDRAPIVPEMEANLSNLGEKYTFIFTIAPWSKLCPYECLKNLFLSQKTYFLLRGGGSNLLVYKYWSLKIPFSLEKIIYFA